MSGASSLPFFRPTNKLFALLTMCVNGEMGSWQRLWFHIMNTKWKKLVRRTFLRSLDRLIYSSLWPIEAEIGKPEDLYSY